MGPGQLAGATIPGNHGPTGTPTASIFWPIQGERGSDGATILKPTLWAFCFSRDGALGCGHLQRLGALGPRGVATCENTLGSLEEGQGPVLRAMHIKHPHHSPVQQALSLSQFQGKGTEK